MCEIGNCRADCAIPPVMILIVEKLVKNQANQLRGPLGFDLDAVWARFVSLLAPESAENCLNVLFWAARSGSSVFLFDP